MIVDAFNNDDLAGALFVLRTFAQDGNWKAYAPIGYLYEVGGIGLEKDYQSAAKWYRQAIVQSDDALAHAGLARMYLNGNGVEVDFRKALYHGQKADDPISWTLLGTMHHLGKGVIKNTVMARNYYERAIGEGYVLPMQYLSRLEFESGNYFRGFCIRLKAMATAARISYENPRDERLQGI